MSASQRRKGADGELEAAGLLSGLLGRVVQRRLGQARDSGHDIEIETGADEGICVEVKRQQNARIHDWLEQAETSALGRGGAWLPAVMWRPNRRGWCVVMSVEDWARLVREAMR